MNAPGPFSGPGPSGCNARVRPCARSSTNGRCAGMVNQRGPEALSQAIVLTPTRRGARALAEAFLAVSGGKAVLLPQVRA